jgi:hypothetical protein
MCPTINHQKQIRAVLRSEAPSFFSVQSGLKDFLQKSKRAVKQATPMKAPLHTLCISVSVILAACQPNVARQSDKDPIVGKYDWLVDGSSHRGTTHIAYEGYIIDVYESDNPRSAGARVAGFWKVLDKEKRQYLLHWKDPWNEFKDVLILSEDGNYLKGTNNIGSVIEGKRVSSSKAPSIGTAPPSAEEREKVKAALLRAIEATKGVKAAREKALDRPEGEQTPPDP